MMPEHPTPCIYGGPPGWEERPIPKVEKRKKTWLWIIICAIVAACSALCTWLIIHSKKNSNATDIHNIVEELDPDVSPCIYGGPPGWDEMDVPEIDEDIYH